MARRKKKRSHILLSQGYFLLLNLVIFSVAHMFRFMFIFLVTATGTVESIPERDCANWVDNIKYIRRYDDKGGIAKSIDKENHTQFAFLPHDILDVLFPLYTGSFCTPYGPKDNCHYNGNNTRLDYGHCSDNGTRDWLTNIVQLFERISRYTRFDYWYHWDNGTRDWLTNTFRFFKQSDVHTGADYVHCLLGNDGMVGFLKRVLYILENAKFIHGFGYLHDYYDYDFLYGYEFCNFKPCPELVLYTRALAERPVQNSSDIHGFLSTMPQRVSDDDDREAEEYLQRTLGSFKGVWEGPYLSLFYNIIKARS